MVDVVNSNGRYLLEIHAGVAAALAAPSLATHYRIERDLSDTLVVSLSQSGGTTEIVVTQAWATRLGARTVAVTNEPDSLLAGAADLILPLEAGPELAVPATKTYTSQLTALAVVADALGSREASLESQLRRIPDEIDRLLAATSATSAAVEALAEADAVLVSGRGLAYSTALELALKFEETNLRPVRGLSYADLRHGPIAVLDRTLAVVLVSATDGPFVGDLSVLARQVRDLGAVPIGIGGEAAFRAACHIALPGPALPETLAPFGLIVPGQSLAEALARYRGLDPDAPRGLSKITQTDREPGS